MLGGGGLPPPSPQRGLAEYAEGRKLGQGAYGAAIQATRLADRKVFVLKKVRSPSTIQIRRTCAQGPCKSNLWGAAVHLYRNARTPWTGRSVQTPQQPQELSAKNFCWR